MALPCLVGQVGLPGTSNGTREARNSPKLESFPQGKNPIQDSISCFLWTDAIEHGEDMGAKDWGVRKTDKLKSNIKYMINYAGTA